MGVVLPAEKRRVIGEFLGERTVEAKSFCIFRASRLEIFTGFIEQPGAFSTGPRTHPEDSAAHISERSEAVENRINPAIQRNIRRPQIGWMPISVPSEEFSDRPPFPTAEIGIPMPAVVLLRAKGSNQP